MTMTSTTRNKAGVFFCAAIAFTAGARADTSPSSLAAAKSDKPISIEQPFSYENTRAFSDFKLRSVYTLAEGSYLPAYEDAGGTYYAGPGYCFVSESVWSDSEKMQANLHKKHFFKCGLYVPNDANLPARIYYFAYDQRKNDAKTETDSDARDQQHANNIILASKVTPLQAGVGGAIGVAIGGALKEWLAESKRNSFKDFPVQPDAAKLRAVLILKESADLPK